jgi:hypothetical protein
MPTVREASGTGTVDSHNKERGSEIVDEVGITGGTIDTVTTVTNIGTVGSITGDINIVETSDYITQVTRGLIPGQRIMRGLGEREGCTAGTDDITRMNELSPAPANHQIVPTPSAAGEQMAVVSESTADTATGTGASSVSISYLDPAGAEQLTTVLLNGQTPVNLTPSDVMFVQDMQVNGLGSANTTEVAAGPIKIHNSATVNLVYSMLAAGGNQSMVPHKMVPAGKTLHLRMWVPAEAQGKRTAIRLRADCSNASPPIRQAGIPLFKSVFYANKTSPGDIMLAYTIPALSIVKASAFGDLAGADCSVHWWGILIDD